MRQAGVRARTPRRPGRRARLTPLPVAVALITALAATAPVSADPTSFVRRTRWVGAWRASPQPPNAGYQEIIAPVRAKGLKLFGGTLLPFKGGLFSSAAADAKRQAVNHWVRTSAAFDGVVNFDRALHDPADLLMLLPGVRQRRPHAPERCRVSGHARAVAAGG